MKGREAAEIINAIAASLRSDPPSFNVTIGSVAGFVAQNTGGVGFLAGGGGGGSMVANTTIGPAQLAPVNDETKLQASRAADLLAIIASEIARPRPDRDQIERVVDQIPTQFVGAAIAVAVQAIVRAVA